MDLNQKIGQLLIFGISGTDLGPETRQRLQRWRPGGIILFARNLQSPPQVKKLVSDLNECLSTPELPLWLCVDQEGGVVVRLTRGVSVFPGNMALGATGNPDYAYAVGRRTALEWGPLGVNVNLAPVLDLSYPQNPGIGVRSLGQDKEAVAKLGVALIRGMQEHGMLATAKHFPGKGLARVDSHRLLPVIDASAKNILETEVLPFRRAVQAGAAFLMTSHSVYPALDPKNPATLSPRILRQLAREELGFQGLILSDDMEMGAVAKVMSGEEAALQFLLAGGDQVLVCHTPEVQEKVFSFLVQAAREKKISEKEIDEKVERIQRVKQQWRQSRFASAGKFKAVETANGDLPLAIARDSITVVKNEDLLIPLKLKPSQRLNVVCADDAPLTQVEEETGEEGSIAGLLRRRHPRLTVTQVEAEASASRIKSILDDALDADLTLILTYNAHLCPSQAAWVRKLLNLGKPAVLCALRNPYDLAQFPQARHTLASYGFRGCSLVALTEVLFGEREARGKWMVELS